MPNRRHVSDRELIRTGKSHIAPGELKLLQENRILVIERKTEGAYVWDERGKRFLDCRNDAGSFNVGRKNTRVVRALERAMREHDIGDNFFVSEAKAELALKLAALSPGRKLTCCTYSVSGGEANDFAVKLARGFTGREEIIAAKQGYHGVTGFALSATGEKSYKDPFKGLAPGFTHVPFGDIRAMKRAIGRKTAAVLLEPVQGEGGVHVPPPDYLREVKELCEKKGALLILDEIQTGFGRTGKMFCSEHFKVVPDIMTIGKSLSGGIYPLTATLYQKRIQKFLEEYPFMHLSSFGGSDLGCVAALAMIRELENKRLVANAKKMGDFILNRLQSLKEKHSLLIADVRGLGLELAVEMRTARLGKELSAELCKRGVLAPFGVYQPALIRMLPSLVIKTRDAEFLLSALEESLEQLSAPGLVERLVA